MMYLFLFVMGGLVGAANYKKKFNDSGVFYAFFVGVVIYGGLASAVFALLSLI